MSRQLYGLLVLLVHLVSWITKYQRKNATQTSELWIYFYFYFILFFFYVYD